MKWTGFEKESEWHPTENIVIEIRDKSSEISHVFCWTQSSKHDKLIASDDIHVASALQH